MIFFVLSFVCGRFWGVMITYSGMKKIKISILLSFVLMFFWATNAFAQDAGGVNISVGSEVIKSFDVSAELSENRLLQVKEVITYDFGNKVRHGIFRDIPESYLRDGMRYNLHLKVTNVLRDGQEENYEVSRDGDFLSLKIGRPDVEITGEHTYTIEYETRKAINFFEGNTELYWNVTGNSWPIKIEKATFRLDSPIGNDMDNVRFICYTGAIGSVEQSCDLMVDDKGYIVESKRVLNSGEGMTVVFGFAPGIIKEATFMESLKEIVRDNWVIIFPLIALIVMIYLWSTKGKDPEPETVVPRYEVPRDMHPLVLSGALGDGAIPHKGITAAIIEMARKGYLHIEYGTEKKLFGDKQTYNFIRKNSVPEKADEWEKIIWNGLFNNGKREKTDFDDLKKDNFYNDVQKASSAASAYLKTYDIFAASPYVVRTLYIIAAVVAGFIVAIIGANAPIGIAMGVVTFFVVTIFGWFMPKRTKEGTSIVAEVKGFKWFLSVTEEERLKFHNAPARTPEQFMEFLPAAIALDVEKEWAEQFKDLTIEPPEWAEGNVSSWTPVMMASALHEMSQASATSVYSAPSSTAGGGGSGFSGGGSGGGFGGGGGGSW